uniref:Surface antigen n=1 Tax=Candidatus Kentrum eta TaxID=2126337 RepID=A0A450UYC6_9GAMM|nr:MAG: Surface antigen [Candidatus Kentron sp. H]VFJ97536.1 MAG: Surface antigen [Candidatus Kentron sp. H]VFK03206.1 MAG: Surface antigen [Candidatus Kentron sp. H]
MMWHKTVISTLIVTGLALGGCVTPTKEQTGTVLGGTLGGLLGSQVGGGSGKTAATIVGTLAGAMVGGSVGRYMDETDRFKTAQSLETTPTGTSSSWRNPDTGYQYTMTPTDTYETDTGPCREYSMDATIGDGQEKIYGTACRRPDGSWEIKS